MLVYKKVELQTGNDTLAPVAPLLLLLSSSWLNEVWKKLFTPSDERPPNELFLCVRHLVKTRREASESERGSGSLTP